MKLSLVLNLIDSANGADPRSESVDSKQVPKELLYGQRMSFILSEFCPSASEWVQIACRGQHIERWKSPRSSYPMTREGYFKWRTELYKFHAQRVGELMLQAGYAESDVELVRVIVGKKNIKSNADTQLLEDVAALVFLQYYMSDFAQEKPDYSEEKWIGIIKKTWGKMSKEAQSFALSGKIKLPEHLVPLILRSIQ